MSTHEYLCERSGSAACIAKQTSSFKSKSLSPPVFKQYYNARECVTFMHNADCSKPLSINRRCTEKHGQQLRQRLKEPLPQSSKLARIIILVQNLVFSVFNYSVQETLVKKFKA